MVRGLLDILHQLEAEEAASSSLLRLTAYESAPSRLVSRFAASPLAKDYHLGSAKEHLFDDVVELHGLTFRGLPTVYELEEQATEVALKQFGATGIDFRPLSGVHAMITTLAACTEVGDLVYSIDPAHGGHFATRFVLERIGRRSAYLPWNEGSFVIDTLAAIAVFEKATPGAIFLDHGAPLAPQPIARLREIVGGDVLIAYDASHTLGLISGGRFQSPLLEGADIIQGNTHKSFPGVQKAIIAATQRYEAGISGALSSGLVSSQHTHHAIATYVAFLEMQQFGAEYSSQMIRNASTLATFLHHGGLRVIGPGGYHTSSHQVLVQPPQSRSAGSWAKHLIRHGVSVNSRHVYGADVLRLGVQSVTRMGMAETEMKIIGQWLLDCFGASGDSCPGMKTIRDLVFDHRNIHYSFDRQLGYWS